MDKFTELAVIVAGIDEEYQNGVINGIIKCARENNANVSVFAAFGGVISISRYDEGEYRIYDVINYDRFDGLILLTNTINDEEVKDVILEKAVASGLPTAVLDCSEHPDFYNVHIENNKAMAEIVRHVIEKHGAKTINYISGPLSNPEAEERYMAFLEEMAAHKLPVDVRRVFFGEFRAADGKKAIEAFRHAGLSVPDAIICANDAMALAVVEELEYLGYRIPNDMIVTGFDNTYNASHHIPSLTTVERPLEEAGYKACEMILGRLEGVEQEQQITLTAAPVFGGSCGCESSNRCSSEDYMRSTYHLINGWKNDVSLLNRMTTALAETESVSEELEVMEKFIREIRCEQFCVCLCKNWDAAFQNEEADTDVRSYTDVMTAPLIIDKGESRQVKEYPLTDMYPLENCSGGNVSYFLPLHFRERCLGYYIIKNSNFPLKSMLCHSIMLNLSNSVENIRKLISLNSMINELDRLYVSDQLCNIYNRNGFVRAADVIFRKCKEEKGKLLISFIDMDGLKLINDNYGHKEGDFALQKLASVISDCCSGDRICARFGGDEFIIVGSSTADNDIEVIEATFHKRLDTVNASIDKPYEIQASIGTIVTGIDKEVTIFSLITKADTVMYEKKKRKKTSRYLRKC
ncbi:MAG: GGDEF domain-containing protein [Ruminococcus sp.]|nr:GGDEF domain-containing protein [Ruminococcus sp.]HRR77009.1 GGDEF domain-containing protein [Ruminococcus sp.]